jgi:hypothetical protein
MVERQKIERLGQEHRQAIDLLGLLRVVPQSRLEIRNRLGDAALGVEIRREIVAVVGQQEATLPGRGIDHQIAQIGVMEERIARDWSSVSELLRVRSTSQ